MEHALDRGDLANIVQAHAKLNVVIGLLSVPVEDLKHKSTPHDLLLEACSLLGVVISDFPPTAASGPSGYMKMKAVLRAIRVLVTIPAGHSAEHIVTDVGACLRDVKEILDEQQT